MVLQGVLRRDAEAALLTVPHDQWGRRMDSNSRSTNAESQPPKSENITPIKLGISSLQSNQFETTQHGIQHRLFRQIQSKLRKEHRCPRGARPPRLLSAQAGIGAVMGNGNLDFHGWHGVSV